MLLQINSSLITSHWYIITNKLSLLHSAERLFCITKEQHFIRQTMTDAQQRLRLRIGNKNLIVNEIFDSLELGRSCDGQKMRSWYFRDCYRGRWANVKEERRFLVWVERTRPNVVESTGYVFQFHVDETAPAKLKCRDLKCHVHKWPKAAWYQCNS